MQATGFVSKEGGMNRFYENSFQIGGYEIGNNRPPLFLPDIGTFFNQDIEKAEKMIRGLHEAGVSTVKGEILHNAEIALDMDYDETYLDHDRTPIKENYRKLIERKVVTFKDYERIFSLCSALNMNVVVSVYDEEGVDFAVQKAAVALKIASSNINHKPLVEYVCRQNLPVIIDTGKASFPEIARMVEWMDEFQHTDYVIQHSPKAPPAPIEQQNMRFLETLKRTFQKPVGLSDHHDGNEMLWVAASLGVSVIEKGLYLDGDCADQGVKHALALSEVPQVLNTISMIHSALGSGEIPLNVPKHQARMGVVAKVDIPAGTVLSRELIRFAFPKLGLGPENWDEISGRKVRTGIKAGSPIHNYDLDD